MKRKIEDEKIVQSEESSQVAKKSKNGIDEDTSNKKTFQFDVKHFRKELKAPTNKSAILLQFLHLCTKSNDNVDYVQKYLECGGTPAEILNQLDDQDNKNLILGSTVFGLLNVALLKIQSNIPHLLQSSEDTCRYFLNSYVPLIEAMLSEKSNSKQQKITLKLLSTIVVLNPELGITILNQLSLQPKIIGHLLTHNVGKEKNDVRQAFIYFIVSFLVDNNTQLIKAVLEKPGLLTSIIPCLVKDGADTILMVVQLFKNSIVNNANISKTLKIRTFTNYISNLFNLFNWKGGSSKSEKSYSDEQKNEVDRNVSDLLEILCTSHKYGIYFKDKLLGTGEIPSNQYLWKALESLETPWNNKGVRRLLITIVKNAPDLYNPIKKCIEESIDCEKPEKLTTTLIFLREIIINVPCTIILQSMPDMDAGQCFNFIKNMYLPMAVLKVLNEAINSNDVYLKNEVILLLQTIFESLKFYCFSSDMNEIHDGKLKKILKSKFQELITRVFPTTDSLVMTMHTILDNISHTKDTEIAETSLSNSEVLINLLNLLLIYDDMIPHCLDPISTMLDIKRLFEKIDFIEDKKTELKLKTTVFLLRADKFAFSPEKPLFKDVLLAILEVYVSQNMIMANEAKSVLYDILDLSGIFSNNRSEIDILLYVIRSVTKIYGESTAVMIMDVIENVLLNTEKYKKLHSKFLVKENQVEFAENFDDIFENIAKYDKFKHNYIVTESELPTFFVTGLMKCSEKISQKHECFILFIEQFLINLLHFQDHPEFIWNLLSPYNLSKNIKDYVIGWRENYVNISKKVFDKNHLLYILSKNLLKNELINAQSVFSNDFCFMDNFEFNIVSNMIIFYTLQQARLTVLDAIKLENAINVVKYAIEKYSAIDEFGEKKFVDVIGKCLSSKVLQDNFLPLKKHKDDEVPLLTKFVLNIIDNCNKKNIAMKTIESCYKPYKDKLHSLLISELKNSKESKKGKKIDSIDYLFLILNYDAIYLGSLVKEILLLDISCMATDTNESSSWIQIICCCLNIHKKLGSSLSANVFRKIMQLYVKIIKELDFVMNISDFEESLYNYMLINPHIVKTLPVNIFEDIFSIKFVSKFTSKLLAIMLKNNSNNVQKFTSIVTKEEIIDKREFVFPLTSAALNHSKFNKSKDVLKTIFEHYKPNITKVIEKPHKSTQVYIDNVDLLVKLIIEFMDVTECMNFFKKIQKFDVTEEFHLEIIETLFFKCLLIDDKHDFVYIDNYLLCIFQMASSILKREELPQDKILKISSVIKNVLLYMKNEENLKIKERSFENVTKNPIWKNFFKCSLASLIKISETSAAETEQWFLGMCLCIDMFYQNDESDVVELFEMIISHSEFLNIMLSNKYSLIKKCLCKLIIIMLYKNRSIMKTSHIPLYLSAYQASMNECDQIILSIIKFYEDNGMSLDEYRPYLWGETGANHFALRSRRKKTSLWNNPTVNHTLNLLDRDKIEATVKYFPNKLSLNSNTKIQINNNDCIEYLIDSLLTSDQGNFKVPKENILKYVEMKLKIKRYEKIVNKVNYDCSWLESSVNYDEIYDPGFIIPLLNYILAPGSAVSCHRILRCGIIAIPFMALSSQCSIMRAAAYNVLYRFTAQLESEMFYKNDKLLWTQFMNTMKSSLDTIEGEENTPETNPKLPNICALYLARSAIIMTNPLDPLFKPVNSFIISKQHIDFTVVPDFLDLFHNSDILYNERRVWILEVLRDGIKTFFDMKLLLKSVTFKMLFDFYSSSLADQTVKLLILEIVNKTVCVPRAAKILCESYGIFPWLSNVCKNIPKKSKSLVSIAINICYNISISLVIDTSFKIAKLRNDNISIELLLNDKCLKLNDYVEFSIVCLLIDLLEKLSSTTAVDMEKYLNTVRKFSIGNIKLISKSQVLKLINDCRSVISEHKKIFEYMSSAIEKKETNSLIASKTLVNSNINENVLTHLNEIIHKWLK